MTLGLSVMANIAPETVERISGKLKRQENGKPVSEYRESDSTVILYLIAEEKESKVTFQGKLPDGIASCQKEIIAIGAYEGSIFKATDVISTCEVLPEMADGLRADGKIYIVVGVVVIILIGFFVYLINTDQKIRSLEKEVE